MNAENHIIAEIMNLHAENEKLRAKNARLEQCNKVLLERLELVERDLEAFIRQNGEGPR